MASKNAKLVANKVSETIRKRKKIVMGEIIRDSGYAESTSLSPTLVTNTLSYQEEIKPIADEMERLRNKAINEMHNKDLSKERLDTLSNVVRNLTHDIQLVKGKPTSNVALNGMRDLTDEELRQISSGQGIGTEGTSEA